MSPSQERNEYLDLADSDSDRGFSDFDHDTSRTDLAGRAAKRRRVTFDTAQIDDVVSDDDEADGDQNVRASTGVKKKDGIDGVENPRRDEQIQSVTASLSLSTRRGIPAPKSAAKAEKRARKSGVVYISRVPPFMKPQALKHFLEPHASKGLGRVYLTPEDHSTYLSRKKSGGNTKKSFIDGWVEFVSKTEAKAAAEILNGNIMGGKKRGHYHDEIWNMKYLSGFKWNHLTEQIANENAERDARMRDEIRRTRKENREFLQDFERGKMQETRDRRAKAKGFDDGRAVHRESTGKGYKQAEARYSEDRANLAGEANVQRALSMIF